jgi:AmiR/NasT family two-component response regulator
MTAYHAEELEKQAIELGAVSCIHKPLDEIKIGTIVEEYFNKKKN